MSFFLWGAVALFAAAALRDLTCRHIEDIWAVLLLGVWCAWALASGLPAQAALLHAGVGGLAFLVMWGAFAMGWMGGADVKLAVPVFLWAGPGNAVEITAIVAICGLILAFCYVLADFLLRFPLPRPIAAIVELFVKERGVPFGIALSAGGALAALASTGPGG